MSTSSPPRPAPTPAAAPSTERTRLLRLMVPLSLLLLLAAPAAGARGPDSSQPDLNPDQGGMATGTLVAVRSGGAEGDEGSNPLVCNSDSLPQLEFLHTPLHLAG